MLVAQRDLGRGVAHALHQLAGVRPGRQRQGSGRVVEVMEPQPLDTSRAGCSKPPAAAEVTAAQVAALADAIGPRYRALVLVAAYGGLRWGELVGLRVKRVDLLHGRVTVAEQVAEVNGQLLPGPPKTEAGRRAVTLPAVAAVALAEHLAEFAEPGPEGLVFPAPEGGYLRRSNFRRRLLMCGCGSPGTPRRCRAGARPAAPAGAGPGRGGRACPRPPPPARRTGGTRPPARR
jgi:integrase